MASVFLCQRPGDVADAAGRVGDRLRAALGAARVVQPFDLGPTDEARRMALADQVGHCDVVVALIGPRWLPETLADPTDGLGVVLTAALARRLPVIPAFLGGARPPQPERLPAALRELPFRNGLAVRPDPEFRRDMEKLLRAVRNPAAVDGPPPPESWLAAVFCRMRPGLVLGGLLGMVLFWVWFGTFYALGPGFGTASTITFLLLCAGGGAAAGWRRGPLASILSLLFAVVMPFVLLCVGFFAGFILTWAVGQMAGEPDPWKAAERFGLPVFGALGLGPVVGIVAAAEAARRAERTGAPAAVALRRIGQGGVCGVMLGMLAAVGGWACLAPSATRAWSAPTAPLFFVLASLPAAIFGMTLGAFASLLPPRRR